MTLATSQPRAHGVRIMEAATLMPHLHAAVCSNKLVFEVGIPEAQSSEVLQQVLVDNRKLPAEHAPHIDIAGVGLEALIVAQNLRG